MYHHGDTAGRLGDSGGVFDAGTVNLADSTISDNIAADNGSGSTAAAWKSKTSATANLTNCTDQHSDLPRRDGRQPVRLLPGLH